MFSAFDALLYVRKTEKNRNEIRAVPASKLCILKPGHLEFEASKQESFRNTKIKRDDRARCERRDEWFCQRCKKLGGGILYSRCHHHHRHRHNDNDYNCHPCHDDNNNPPPCHDNGPDQRSL